MEEVKVYTIGYTAFDIDSFIKCLHQFGISFVIDVRSIPVASEYYKVYSKTTLEPLLKQNGIKYVNFADEFGARQTDSQFYKKYGYLDFEDFIKSDNFIAGINRVKKATEDLNFNVVLMCAEKDPITCHRAIMVARGLNNAGIKVKHILSGGILESHADLEKRLVDMNCPDQKQTNIFEQTKSFEQYLEEAYRKQNEKIGFNPDKVKEKVSQ